MTEPMVEASIFEDQCLLLVDQVAASGVSIVVTRSGRPVARLVAVGDQSNRRSTMGSVRLLADDDELYFSTGAF